MRDNGEDDDLRRACRGRGPGGFRRARAADDLLQPLPDPPPIDGIAVHRSRTRPVCANSSSVNAAAYATYGMPAEVLADLFDETGHRARGPAAPSWWPDAPRLPVATAMIFESDGVASVQWVGTIPAARDTGLGALVTVW